MSITADEFDEGFDDQDEGGLSGFYVLAIFLILLAAFGVIVYFAYQKGLATAQASDDALPVVAADPSPIREEVPLAMRDDRRDEVYDRLEGVTPTTVIAEVDADRDPLDGFDQTTTRQTTTRTASQATGQPDAAAPEPEPVAATPAPEPEPVPVRVASTRPVTPDPVAAQPEAEPAIASAATHVVQVGAFGSNDEAMGFYKSLSTKHGDLVASRSPDVQSAEVKGTTYHRLRLGPFTSKADASGYCDDLKANGQDCFVKAL